MRTKPLKQLVLVPLGVLLPVLWACQALTPPQHPMPTPFPAETEIITTPLKPPATIQPTGTPNLQRSITILVDDFSPQPYQGGDIYPFNRLGGDRGAINDSLLEWGRGQVTTTVSSGNSWGGVWTSLNHPARESLPINFSSILPLQIGPAYQSQVTGISVLIARGTANRPFKLELKDGSEVRWQNQIILDGGPQVINAPLPALENINQLVWVLDQAAAGDFVVVERVSFTATSQITDTATAAFVWSYAMLLNNWNPTTGLVRDKAKDAGGEFDAIQATGSLAAATAMAAQLGVVTRSDAIQIINQISHTLLNNTPRRHGLWPHWVKTSPSGDIAIVENTEWSSVDTVIAAMCVLNAQSGLGLDATGTEQMLHTIDWNDLVTAKGISHGYTYAGDLIPYAWDVFGGESWLVALAYASVSGQVVPVAYPSPPTANGSGFIDELAWLFVPPPAGPDQWGVDWTSYRSAAANTQTSYYPSGHPSSCLAQLDLFGLSAAEVPDPSIVPPENIYQAFGVGGRFGPANDGSDLLGAPVVAPHYAAMIASLRPRETIQMWTWLIDHKYFSPLNNVESLMFPAGSNCDLAAATWNQLQGSWNLSLQTLGWGRYLAQREGQTPVLWQAVTVNPLLRQGYNLLAKREPPPPLTATQRPLPTPVPTPKPSYKSKPWADYREGEYPEESTVGTMILRANASARKVHGQFGTTADAPWPAQAGYVAYSNLNIPQTDHLYLKLKYSKYSPSSVPILIYINDEPTPRAALYPQDTGDWDNFVWTKLIDLGYIESKVNVIKFYTEGQQYGVADLDRFILSNRSPLVYPTKTPTPHVPMLRNPGS